MTPTRTITGLPVEELTRQLLARKTSRPRFSIDLHPDEICRILWAACIAETTYRGRRFTLTDEVKSHIRATAEWLADPHATFGLMFTGLYGNGKSTLMTAVGAVIDHLFESTVRTADNPRPHLLTVKARKVAELVGRDNRGQFRALVDEPLLAIDDMGDEPATVIEYGQVYTPIKDLLDERYDRRRLTIVTTNRAENPARDLHQLTDHYKARIVDRLREMMTVLVFAAPSFRTPAHRLPTTPVSSFTPPSQRHQSGEV